MRHFAITGIETASWISEILSGSAMRATPPSRRMSAGTRSSAITATAPASSAMRACSASVTSMITPPLSISARPLLTLIVPVSGIAVILASRAPGLAKPPGSTYRRRAAQPLSGRRAKMNVAAARPLRARPRRGFRILGRRGHPEHSVSFPELVWLHHLRQEELKKRGHEPYEGPAEDRYRRYLRWFEEEHGKIVDSYWCTDDASGVALTVKRRPLMFPDVVRLHWATDWTTKDKPKLMNILYRAEAITVRVHEVLRDTSQRLAMQSLFTVFSHVLGFSETERAHNDRAIAELERETRVELKGIESYYQRAAGRSGQIVYAGGMLLGALPLLLLVLLAFVLRLADSNDAAVRTGLFCFAAGGLGALISVMSRMTSNRVRVDWEFGKDTLRTLGALRPFVGGIFGLMTFFALKSGVVALDIANSSKSAYFYILFAFAAGFSERLAQDMLLGPTVQAGAGRGRHARHPRAQGRARRRPGSRGAAAPDRSRAHPVHRERHDGTGALPWRG